MSNEEQVLPVPGWYPQGDQLRYWDGARWVPDAPPPRGYRSTPTPTPRNPLQAVASVLRRYALFEGRSTRSEYWWWVASAFAVLAALVALSPTDPITREPTGAAGAVLGIGMLAAVVPQLAVTVRRLHDSGRSGAWILIQAIPIVGTLVMLVFLLMPSERRPNRHGPAPVRPSKGLR